MVFRVRCFICGAYDVRLILGGREIIHARCQACNTNLLAEVLALEEEVEMEAEAAREAADRERRSTKSIAAVSRTEKVS